MATTTSASLGPPSAKRRKLEYVKCDFCRADKQKCEPVHRSWPDEKCDRCTSKGFRCSEGRRLPRKTKHTERTSKELGPTTVPSPTVGTIPETTPSISANQWSLLFHLHQTMSEAVVLLRKMREKNRRIFTPNMPMKDFIMLSDSDYDRNFEKHFADLHAVTLRLGQNKVPQLPDEQDPKSHSTLLERSLSRDFYLNSTICSLCEPSSKEESEIDQMVRLDDIGGELQYRIRRLQRHQFHGEGFEPEDIAFQKEWELIEPLAASLSSKTHELVKFLDLDPVIATYPPILLPKPSYWVIMFEISDSYKERVDFLGRSFLHVTLDEFEMYQPFEDYLVDYLEEYPLIKTKDIIGQLPLHIACQEKLEAVVKELVGFGEVNKKTVYGMTALHYAAANNSGAICELLLELPDLDVNSLDKTGNTPLGHAARKGHKSIVRLLLEDPRITPNEYRNSKSPLAQAIVHNHLDIARLLLDNGANPDTSWKGEPLVMYCASRWSSEELQMICEKDASLVNAINSQKKTPLIIAVNWRRETTTHWLLQQPGVDANHHDGSNWTALTIAVKNKYTQLVKILIASPKVDLLERGGAYDGVRMTAIELARHHKYDEISGLLQEEILRRSLLGFYAPGHIFPSV
ncbi:ankyrin [Corynespora cassiicola Philippines]|uniref:Ankyrin n=1 Tax=Corynespora cassiicola Philippines TaxID=1448308 RepID=A0A2T2N468_CORCC|nr:ankyrin [Corynespora cassiicola Philippines]